LVVRTARCEPSEGLQASFRSPRFLLLLVGETVNSVGSWASAIAIWGFAAYRFHAGPHQVALLIACWAAPAALLGPLAGVHIDRLGARGALVLGYAASAAAAVTMASSSSVTGLDWAALAYGACRAITGPAADALPPRVVRPRDLLTANSLLGAAATAGQVLGPLAAGVTLAIAGFRAAFVVDALTYLIGAGVVGLLPVIIVASPERRSWRVELGDGLRFAVRHPAVRTVLAVSSAVSLTSGSFLVVEPLYAHLVLHRPPSQFALFEAAAGVGGVLTGLVIPKLGTRLTGRRVFPLAAVVYGLAAAAFIGTTSVPVAYTGALCWGVAAAVFSAVGLTALQRLSPAHSHGRVMALRSALNSGADTAGLPLAAIIIGALGVRVGALALAAVAFVVGVSTLRKGLPLPPLPHGQVP